MSERLYILPHQRAIHRLARMLLWFIGRCEMSGHTNLPERGPFIFCANHTSYFDAPVAFAALPNVRWHFFAARKYRRHLFFGPLLSLFDVIWITQRGADREALDAAHRVLRAGHLLAMSPEGTRSTTGALIEARPGVAYLATGLDIPVVPCAIVGTDRVKTNLPRLRGTPMRITVGAPFRLAPIESRNRSQQLRDRTDVIMARIAHMLPESYRGVYADHPYLRRLERGEAPLPGEIRIED